MNRQQRRAQAKRLEAERKYYNQLADEYCRVSGWQLEMNLLCFALAIRKAYGWGQVRIARGMAEFNNQLLRFGQGASLEQLRDELKAETGILMTLQDDRISLLKGKGGNGKKK